MEPVEDSLTKGRAIFPEEVNRYVLEKRKGGKKGREEGRRKQRGGEGRGGVGSKFEVMFCIVLKQKVDQMRI